MALPRGTDLATVSARLVHPDDGISDGTCSIEIIARAHGGSARSVVRCLFSGEFAHVHPVSVRRS